MVVPMSGYAAKSRRPERKRNGMAAERSRK
jgi:hypothetical protein